jgi:hypothetical protein
MSTSQRQIYSVFSAFYQTMLLLIIRYATLSIAFAMCRKKSRNPIHCPSRSILPASLQRPTLLFFYLMPHLRLKYKDLDVSFRLDKAEEAASQLPPAAQASDQPTPEERSRFEQLARISPRAAILEMRSDLEEALRSPYRMSDPVNAYNGANLQVMIRALRKNSYIDEKTAGILDDLSDRQSCCPRRCGRHVHSG